MFSPASNPPMLAANPSDLDGSGTINPASLNPSGAFASHHLSGTQHLAPFSPPTNTTTDFESESKRAGLGNNPSPRGVKRSRSPEDNPIGNEITTAAEEPVRRKRGRPPKNKNPAVPQSPQLPNTPSQSHQPLPQQLHQTPAQSHVPQPGSTPQLQHAAPVATLPTPPKPPAKPPTVKALPTVRDHTTDQLTPEGDEYIPREFDDSGEKKVMHNGHLLGQREYKCRTFNVPNRGEKLFMLATECARVLGYRDSYLLFNKNRSLFKIIATQTEKDDLIQQELLPYSYRSRQIAIVTARSMFRQFGSRVIVGGRRVRDDYWEMKARKQGFTEEDPAGEKRPGAKQRAAAASEQAAQAAAAAAAAAQVQQQQLGQQSPQQQSAGIQQATSTAQQQQQAHQQVQQQQVQQQQQQQQTQLQQAQQSQQPHDQQQPLYPSHDAEVQLDQHTQPQMVQPGLGGPAAPVSLAPLPMIHVMQEERTPKELYSVQRPRQEITGPPYQDRTTGAPRSQIMDQAQHAAEFNKSLTQSRNVRGKTYAEHYKKSPPQQQQQIAPPPLAHHNPHASAPQQQQQHHHIPPPQHPHPQMQPPPMMSPQQLSSLNHQQQPHPHQQQHVQPQQHHQQPLHPMMQQSPARTSQGIKPEQLHAPPGPSAYMPNAGYYQQQQPHPSHPQQQQHARGPMQSHSQAMSPMHMQHQQQSPGMYPPGNPQQFMQQPPQQQHQHQQHQQQQHAQYPPQGYRPPPPPQQQQQQQQPPQQWWSGA